MDTLVSDGCAARWMAPVRPIPWGERQDSLGHSRSDFHGGEFPDAVSFLVRFRFRFFGLVAGGERHWAVTSIECVMIMNS